MSVDVYMTNQSDERVSTGLEWLDQLLGGGLPRQSLVVIAGPPGAGKSTLAFHMMAEAVLQDTNAMLVTTTHQPVSKLRTQYGHLSFLGPTGALDKMEFF
jgi:circadian clock protein KaiC